MRQGSRERAGARRCGIIAAVCVVVASSPPEAGAQTPSDEAKVSAWASGGTSTTTTPADKDGKPGAGVAPVGAIPFWQAPATPQAVVQGGAIPPGWQPQAVPYQGIGPDGRPMTMYIAPTYVFTYQSGPPVLAAPTVNRSQAYGAPQQPYPPGWNFATSGAQPVTPTLPPATVARYQPTPYQFPTDSRALTGTPVAPPAGVPAPPPQTWGTAPPAPQPPTQWGASDAAPAAAAPSSGDWVTVVPPAVAGAALAAGATAADTPSSEPQMAALPPPVTPVPAPSSIPAQPVSSSGMSSPPSASRAANSHLWRVVGVSDGDTVTCLDENNQQQKVRLAEIDAPEIGQDYGKNSREALAGMVFGKTVEVVDDGRDRYGRWIGHLSVDGMDVNRQMVATGNAWHYAAYSTDQNLAALQAQAQSQRIGLWSQPNPTSPWDYRASGK